MSPDKGLQPTPTAAYWNLRRALWEQYCGTFIHDNVPVRFHLELILWQAHCADTDQDDTDYPVFHHFQWERNLRELARAQIASWQEGNGTILTPAQIIA